MKASLLLVWLLVLGTWQAACAQAPVDTTGGRYFQPVFTGVTATPNVQFGATVDFLGRPQPLLMDIYQPTGDATAQRPVIIFAHQGGFVTGSRTESYMVAVCTQFARLGYVTASIDYRLNPFLVLTPTDTAGVSLAAIRGMQDLRAAVRFFREDAATANTYRVSPSRIVVGGASAGGFMALEVGYLDKVSETPANLNLTAADIEGSSGHPGYSSAVLAVLNLSGATSPVSIIEPGNVPLYSAHGTADAVVPYLKGRVGAGLPPKYVFGSGLLNPYAGSVGVPNVLRRFSKAPHIPQYPVQSASTGSANSAAYADTTYRDIRAFLRPLLGPFVAARPSLLITSGVVGVAAGDYQDITITGGQGRLDGNITVYGTLTVRGTAGQLPGSLNTNCFVVDGPGNFDLQAGGALSICDPAGISASGATGAIRNTGTRTFSADANYAYIGFANQVTGDGLPTTVRELEVALVTGNTLTLSQPVNVAQRFLPTSGTLNNSAQVLTLLSGPGGTALITPGPGTLVNGFNVQRYLDPSVNRGLGYRHLSLPFDYNGFVNVTGPAFTMSISTGYNGSSRPDLVTPFPNVFGYDQQRALTSPATSYSEFDKGWFVVANTFASRRGLGYAVNVAAGQALTLSGPLTHNNEDIAVTLSAAATPTAGWHLLGNPFASALSWDAVPVPAGMSGAMYIFVSNTQYTGNYRAYVNGVGGSGATIPLGQAFFVRSLASAPVTLTFPLSARITNYAAANTQTVQRGPVDARPRLRLTLAAAATPALADEAYLYQEAGATPAPDAAYDAAKLPNSSGLNLATVANGEELAINGLPVAGAPATVPLALTVPQPGAYVLTAAELANYAPGALTLTDALTGTRTPLAAGTRYAFTVAGATAPGRFALELSAAGVLATSPAQALAAQLQVYPNPASSSFRVALPLPAGAAAPAVAELTNALGQTVRRQPLTATGRLLTGEVEVRGLAPGVYQLHLRVAGQPLVRRVVVQ
ncbi:alpha/beta hydrolase fold domain-containing protein [Hymenobacter ruricola]|uniref:Carboxylesterase family protein n=1 Tax=Hymenobacter ruricola TaxID=2791023 RepID=A0ABS0IAU8_9BACT|nr:alpha/beta hydrolase fold domain-containing protein [Hymenobacter ruricola]MBF9223697.1 carboxylesterase family protein [Hymenobacter ruricola]